jgi:hypothetical protein
MINRDEIRRKLAVKINYLFEFIKANLMEETPQYFPCSIRGKSLKLLQNSEKSSPLSSILISFVEFYFSTLKN